MQLKYNPVFSELFVRLIGFITQNRMDHPGYFYLTFCNNMVFLCTIACGIIRAQEIMKTS